MTGGYLVRIRRDLAIFLAHASTKYDIFLFTAADGSVMWNICDHQYLCVMYMIIMCTNCLNVYNVCFYFLWFGINYTTIEIK